MILVEGMTLYHGSYALVEQPDLVRCRDGKDFGRGFYLTTDFAQAKRFVRTSVNKAIRDGRISGQQVHGYISRFAVGAIDGMRYHEYAEANAEWLHCVAAHRMGMRHEMKTWADYDILAGKIANDNTNVVIAAYIRGLYGEVGSLQADETAIGLLEPENLKDQVCMRTVEALERMSFQGAEEVAL